MARKLYPDGLYKTTVSIKKYDENGNLMRVHLSAPTNKELDQKVAELKAKMKFGMFSHDGNKIFGEYAIYWYNTYQKGHCADATAQKYLGIINNHLEPLYNMHLSEITKSDIQNLINMQEGHPDTQRMIKVTANQIFESAIDDELIYKNPCKKIKVKQASGQTKSRALTDAEKNAISELKREHAFSPKEQLYVDTLYVSGLRPEEALALTFSDIKDNTITVNKALKWKGGKGLKEPKSKAGYRHVDVPAWYQEEVNSFHLDNNTNFIFTGINGDLISQSTYKRFWLGIWNKINVKLGGKPKIVVQNVVKDPGIAVTDLTPYMFRHNYCTMLYELKVDVKEASRIMGHSNVRITLDIYTHLDSIKSTICQKVAGITL